MKTETQEEIEERSETLHAMEKVGEYVTKAPLSPLKPSCFEPCVLCDMAYNMCKNSKMSSALQCLKVWIETGSSQPVGLRYQISDIYLMIHNSSKIIPVK